MAHTLWPWVECRQESKEKGKSFGLCQATDKPLMGLSIVGQVLQKAIGYRLFKFIISYLLWPGDGERKSNQEEFA